MRLQKFDATVTLVCCALLAFLGWHASKGPRGFAYADRLAAETAKLEEQRKAVAQDRARLESRVVLLRPDSIDPDMLDEQARTVLLAARDNELVVLEKR